MITRLYVDNYKCLVNFEYKPARLQLLFGENGTGKSTVFEVLERLRDFLCWGISAEQAFPAGALTAWQSRPEQRFELEIEGNGGRYCYVLLVEHIPPQNRIRVKQEELRFERNTLYYFDGEDGHLFADDGTPGPVFPQHPSKSGVASIPEREHNQRLTWFRGRVGMIYVLAIDPFRMQDVSFVENRAPDRSLGNFASWYRHLAQDSPETMRPLFDSLERVIDEFVQLKLTSEGETARVLRVVMKRDDGQENELKEYNLVFNQLSHGHRCLVALFTILHCAVRPDMTICIDEPDNFIALRELQPWLTELCDRVEEKSSQCLLISHHPELIDLLAVRHGVRFIRPGSGPVRIKPFEWSETGAIRPSELVARGWDD